MIANTVLETPQAIANLSVQSQIPMMSYLWHFDDKTTSTLPNPSHEYTYPGIYNIEVKCNDENGCAQTLKQQIEVRAFVIHDQQRGQSAVVAGSCR